MYRSLYAIYIDDTNGGVRRSKMRTTVLLVVSLLGILATVQGQNETAPVSSNDAVTLGMDMLLEFENGMLSVSTLYSLVTKCCCLLLHTLRVHMQENVFYIVGY